MALGARDIQWTVVSAMVGGGIFVAPTIMLREGASPNLIFLLFAISGTIAMLGALTVSELAARQPGNGGAYLYLRSALGPWASFLFNWTRFGMMQTGALAFLSLMSIDFFAHAMGRDNPEVEALLAILLLAATAGLNAIGLRVGKNVQAGLTILKIGALLAIVVGVILSGQRDIVEPLPTRTAGIGSLLLLSVFAMGGWTQVTFLAGEMSQPTRLAKPMTWSILGVTCLYLVSLLALFLALPAVGEEPIAMLAGAQNLWGGTGFTLVSLVVAIAVLGGLHTMTLTGPRLYQAAARQGQWPPRFANENRHDAPDTALMYQALWAMILILLSLLATQAYKALIGSISTAIWVFHVLLALAWFKLRKSHSPFRTPLGPLVAGLFFIGTSAVVAIAIWDDIALIQAGAWRGLSAIYALGIIVLGLLSFCISNLRRRFKPQ